MPKVPPSAVPQCGACASPGRAWRIRAARHYQSEAQPLVAQPPSPRLELAASKVADVAAFDRQAEASLEGVGERVCVAGRGVGFGEACLLQVKAHALTAIAREPTRVVAISKGDYDRLIADRRARLHAARLRSTVKVPPLAVPQLAPCASSVRTWRL